MRKADLTVDSRWRFREDKRRGLLGSGGIGYWCMEFAVDEIDSDTRESPYRFGPGRLEPILSPRPWTWLSFCPVPEGRVESTTELELEPASPSTTRSGPPAFSSAFAHVSQSIHPTAVPTLPQQTTETGLTRPWTIPTKQQMKITTEQTCCTMTVESATNGQKS